MVCWKVKGIVDVGIGEEKGRMEGQMMLSNLIWWGVYEERGNNGKQSLRATHRNEVQRSTLDSLTDDPLPLSGSTSPAMFTPSPQNGRFLEQRALHQEPDNTMAKLPHSPHIATVGDLWVASSTQHEWDLFALYNIQ